MRSPRILLASTSRPRPVLANFAPPAAALLALLALALLLWPPTATAQLPSGAGAQQSPPAPTPQRAPPARADQPLPQAAGAQPSLPAFATQRPLTSEEVVEKIMAQERTEVGLLRQYSPLVETYIQYLRPDKQLGAAPAGDKYYLGRAELSKGVELEPLDRDQGIKHKLIGSWGEFFNSEFLPRGFLQMIYLDVNSFDRSHYRLEYVRREFLGEVRCLVFDVDPVSRKDKGRFVGRIWVEDQDFHIVRFDGAYGGSSLTSNYFNFDSWRANVGKNLWLPSFIYSEEGSVRDKSENQNDYSPLQAERSWDHQAEDNVTDRLERLGLLAPYGEVDKVLETVVNNLEVTNDLDIQPEVRCRVLMTSTLESFTLGHSIVLSRGLIDVLPDEASLAAILAHELGHIVLGHRIDSQYAFFSRLRFDDKDTFKHFDFARTPDEEEAARQKGMELLKNSPYKDKAASAQLFLDAARSRAKEIPNLISPHLGDSVSAGWTAASARPAPADKSSASDKPATPPEEKPAANAIVALPLGGRVKVDPWNDQLRMLKSKPVGTVAEGENAPFQITPFMFYLTRLVENAPASPAPGTEAAPQMDAPPKPQIRQEELPGLPRPDPPQKP